MAWASPGCTKALSHVPSTRPLENHHHHRGAEHRDMGLAGRGVAMVRGVASIWAWLPGGRGFRKERDRENGVWFLRGVVTGGGVVESAGRGVTLMGRGVA